MINTRVYIVIFSTSHARCMGIIITSRIFLTVFFLNDSITCIEGAHDLIVFKSCAHEKYGNMALVATWAAAVLVCFDQLANEKTPPSIFLEGLDMKLFDKLLLETTKSSYVKRLDEKYNIPEDIKLAMKNFVMSQKCDDEIYRLKSGSFLFYDLKETLFDSTTEYYNLAARKPAFYLPPRQNLIRKANSEKRRIIYNYAQMDSYLLKYITFALMDFDDLYEDGLCSFRKDNRTAAFFIEYALLILKEKNIFFRQTLEVILIQLIRILHFHLSSRYLKKIRNFSDL